MRTVLITGATGGIGQATARQFGRDGFRLALHYHSNGDGAENLRAELAAAGSEATTFQADLRDTAAARAMVQAVHGACETIDVLVNNAGVLDASPLSFMSDEQWHEVMAANLHSAFYVTREVSMVMARQRQGRIINVSSDAGRLGGAGRSNYSAAKAGLAGFTKAVARELAGSNVQVNAVSPGYIETPMTADLDENKRKAIAREVPGRRLGTAMEVAALIAFLASDAAGYITGQEISVDGGLFMG